MRTIGIALRNLGRQKRRSLLLGGAIAFGVFIVTLIDGTAGAFMNNVSENFADFAAGHIFVAGVEKSASGRDLSVIRDDSLLMSTLRDTGIPVTYVSKRSVAVATVMFQGKSAQQSIQGVDFSTETFLTSRMVINKGSLSAMSDRKGLILSEGTARRLNAEIGDKVIVRMQTYSGQQNAGDMTVRALIPDNSLMASFSAYANLDYVNELLNLRPGEYMTLGFYLPSLRDMERYANAFDAALAKRANVFDRAARSSTQGFRGAMSFFGGSTSKETWTGVRYRVTTLNDLLAQVQQIVVVLNTVSTVILLVLFLIIMVGIMNTFRMILFERIREIGTMRAVGMQRGRVRSLFLLEALFLSLGGVAAGMLLGGIVMALVSLIDLGQTTPLAMVLRNGHMTFRLPFPRAVQNVLIIGVLTLLAAYLPARRAALLPPAEALRTTK
jgi:putative ABC transport system permease protein